MDARFYATPNYEIDSLYCGFYRLRMVDCDASRREISSMLRGEGGESSSSFIVCKMFELLLFKFVDYFCLFIY